MAGGDACNFLVDLLPEVEISGISITSTGGDYVKTSDPHIKAPEEGYVYSATLNEDGEVIGYSSHEYALDDDGEFLTGQMAQKAQLDADGWVRYTEMKQQDIKFDVQFCLKEIITDGSDGLIASWFSQQDFVKYIDVQISVLTGKRWKNLIGPALADREVLAGAIAGTSGYMAGEEPTQDKERMEGALALLSLPMAIYYEKSLCHSLSSLMIPLVVEGAHITGTGWGIGYGPAEDLYAGELGPMNKAENYSSKVLNVYSDIILPELGYDTTADLAISDLYDLGYVSHSDTGGSIFKISHSISSDQIGIDVTPNGMNDFLAIHVQTVIDIEKIGDDFDIDTGAIAGLATNSKNSQSQLVIVRNNGRIPNPNIITFPLTEATAMDQGYVTVSDATNLATPVQQPDFSFAIPLGKAGNINIPSANAISDIMPSLVALETTGPLYENYFRFDPTAIIVENSNFALWFKNIWLAGTQRIRDVGEIGGLTSDTQHMSETDTYTYGAFGTYTLGEQMGDEGSMGMPIGYSYGDRYYQLRKFIDMIQSVSGHVDEITDAWNAYGNERNILKAFMSQFYTIEEMTIYRERVDKNQGHKDERYKEVVVSAMENAQGRISETINKEHADFGPDAELHLDEIHHGKIKEIHKEGYIPTPARTYAFVDYDLAKADAGVYEYSVKFRIRDHLPEFAAKFINRLDGAIQQLNTYYDLITAPGRYDPRTNRLTKAGREFVESYYVTDSSTAQYELKQAAGYLGFAGSGPEFDARPLDYQKMAPWEIYTQPSSVTKAMAGTYATTYREQLGGRTPAQLIPLYYVLSGQWLLWAGDDIDAISESIRYPLKPSAVSPGTIESYIKVLTSMRDTLEASGAGKVIPNNIRREMSVKDGSFSEYTGDIDTHAFSYETIAQSRHGVGSSPHEARVKCEYTKHYKFGTKLSANEAACRGIDFLGLLPDANSATDYSTYLKKSKHAKTWGIFNNFNPSGMYNAHLYAHRFSSPNIAIPSYIITKGEPRAGIKFDTEKYGRRWGETEGRASFLGMENVKNLYERIDSELFFEHLYDHMDNYRIGRSGLNEAAGSGRKIMEYSTDSHVEIVSYTRALKEYSCHWNSVHDKETSTELGTYAVTHADIHFMHLGAASAETHFAGPKGRLAISSSTALGHNRDVYAGIKAREHTEWGYANMVMSETDEFQTLSLAAYPRDWNHIGADEFQKIKDRYVYKYTDRVITDGVAPGGGGSWAHLEQHKYDNNNYWFGYKPLDCWNYMRRMWPFDTGAGEGNSQGPADLAGIADDGCAGGFTEMPVGAANYSDMVVKGYNANWRMFEKLITGTQVQVQYLAAPGTSNKFLDDLSRSPRAEQSVLSWFENMATQRITPTHPWYSIMTPEWKRNMAKNLAQLYLEQPDYLNPVWKPLSNWQNWFTEGASMHRNVWPLKPGEKLLCRLVPIDIPEIGLSYPHSLGLPIYYEYFYLVFDDV